VFDKTGTLTKGEFNVVRFESTDNTFTKERVLELAAALEQNSEHPIATGITRKAKELNLTLPQPADFKAITGKGIEAKVHVDNVKVVSPGYLKENNISIAEQATSHAETVVFVLVNDKTIGFIALADEVRPESAEAIKILQSQNIKCLLLTGDNKEVAKVVSDSLGMDGFIAEVLPHQKLEKIKALQQQGNFVAMTGDGVNDAPALAQADVGIAVGSGSDIAAETADIVLVNSNPKDVANLILFGKATYRKMIQNLAWATGYNVVALPLAAGVLYNAEIMLSPAIGAVLMSVSTIVVALNARMLKV
jgi:P-type Cu2+ transporter